MCFFPKKTKKKRSGSALCGDLSSDPTCNGVALAGDTGSISSIEKRTDLAQG
jgi:hypothetical protein